MRRRWLAVFLVLALTSACGDGAEGAPSAPRTSVPSPSAALVTWMGKFCRTAKATPLPRPLSRAEKPGSKALIAHLHEAGIALSELTLHIDELPDGPDQNSQALAQGFRRAAADLATPTRQNLTTLRTGGDDPASVDRILTSAILYRGIFDGFIPGFLRKHPDIDAAYRRTPTCTSP